MNGLPDSETLDELTDAVAAVGYATFAASPAGARSTPRVVESLLTGLGTPIKVFPTEHLWRLISVRTDKHPNRSEGTGESPLHMDFVNAYNPPDYVCLLCIRNDPLGGGITVLAPTGVRDNLTPHQRKQLGLAQFSDGRVVNLANIGGDINPFRVIDDDAYWNFRYTSNLLNSRYEPGVDEALRSLARELRNASVRIRLQPGMAIIFDQHRWVHGKTPLGREQETVPAQDRRLLLQSFCRKRTNPLR